MSLLDSAASFSSLIAPVIDRTAISVHNAVDKAQMQALRGKNRFHPGALALFAGPLATGGLSTDEYRELTRYQHFGSSADFLAGLAERGAVDIGSDGMITTTPAAVEVSKTVARLQAETVTRLFAPRQASLAGLRALMTRARDAATADPLSPTARLMARAWLPDDASDAAHVWDCSVVLRMHRADSHASAWKEDGRTAPEMRAMGPGPEREAIERRTEQLAATAWVGLSTDERLELLSGLAALPGTGSPVG
jgi:hypothetical protein